VSKRAKVIFHDGYMMSPFIETNTEDLEARLRKVAGLRPAAGATQFVVRSYAARHPVTIHNTPQGYSFGSARATVERPEFWPGAGDQGGVFFVKTGDQPVVEFWGGTGFDDSEEFTAAIPQVKKLYDED